MCCFFVSGNNSTAQTWTVSNTQDKGRSALPRRRTGFNAGALIPGSVSTMVSIPESDDGRSSRSIASPSFQNLLDHDESSDYETDLEEDFPGTFVQCYDWKQPFSEHYCDNKWCIICILFLLFSSKESVWSIRKKCVPQVVQRRRCEKRTLIF